MENNLKKKIKLYLLTGFLGSGKTSFLKETLNKIENHKYAVIMNEFGKVGIDGGIIKKDGMELVEINRGSIFCSCLQLSFVKALIEMAEKNVEFVFVESSGLADPSNIGQFLEAVEANIGEVYDYSGSICLVDGLNFLTQIDDIETVNRQLKYCNLAVISKTDLIDTETYNKVVNKAKEINPGAIITNAINGKVDLDFLTVDLMKTGWIGNEATTNTTDNKPKTLTLTYPDKITKAQLNLFLDKIKPSAYRMKGYFQLDDGWNQVDVVGNTVDYKIVANRQEPSELVIISNIGSQIIKPIFNAWEKIVGKEMKLR